MLYSNWSAEVLSGHQSTKSKSTVLVTFCSVSSHLKNELDLSRRPTATVCLKLWASGPLFLLPSPLLITLASLTSLFCVWSLNAGISQASAFSTLPFYSANSHRSISPIPWLSSFCLGGWPKYTFSVNLSSEFIHPTIYQVRPPWCSAAPWKQD